MEVKTLFSYQLITNPKTKLRSYALKKTVVESIKILVIYLTLHPAINLELRPLQVHFVLNLDVCRYLEQLEI